VRRPPVAAATTGALHHGTWAFAALLASLSMLGPFAVDMYLPAFAAISGEFDVSAIAVQQTLSAYLFAYAFMMLWHGSLSDALGRRPIILGGLVVYGIASLGCAIAGNIESLWLFRTLQGLAAGSGLVVGRAMIRDRYEGPAAQRLMSQITLFFGIAPAVAPVIGGAVLNISGWRAIFWVMLLLTFALLMWAWKALPETLPRAHRQMLRPRQLWKNYRAVLLKPEFLLLASIPTLNFAGFFIYIASAPVFLEKLGVSTWGFAWLFVPMIAGIMAGATISGRVAGRLSAKQTATIGYGFLFAGALLSLLVAAFVVPSVPWHVLPIAVFTLGSSLLTERDTANARPVSRGARSDVLAARIRSVRVLGRRRGNRLPVSRAIARRTCAWNDRVHGSKLWRLATVLSTRDGVGLRFLFAM
jgi:DHA1 family bicyclomycin/chloramphenicol resistance-like MFS transporter